jgi:hypothetical protein
MSNYKPELIRLYCEVDGVERAVGIKYDDKPFFGSYPRTYEGQYLLLQYGVGFEQTFKFTRDGSDTGTLQAVNGKYNGYYLASDGKYVFLANKNVRIYLDYKDNNYQTGTAIISPGNQGAITLGESIETEHDKYNTLLLTKNYDNAIWFRFKSAK